MSQPDTFIDTPAGEVLIRLPFEHAAALEDWVLCAAVRLVKGDGGCFALELTNDLELITRPEGSA